MDSLHRASNLCHGDQQSGSGAESGGKWLVSEANDSAAPGQLSGFILQLERALYHLSVAGEDVTVGVEHLDDVSLSRGGRTFLQEQDKNSVRSSAKPLGDRSYALWRTLQIWLDSAEANGWCSTYLMVSNTAINTSLVSAIKDVGARGAEPVVEALRAVGGKVTKAKVQEQIDAVLARDDSTLAKLVERIEVIDHFDVEAAHGTIANGFAIDPRIDPEPVIAAIFHWIVMNLRAAWKNQQPGLISREACIRQCREIERRQARRRLLPRPARQVVVSAAERGRHLSRAFVSHLVRIELEEDEVFEAVEHFLQFNIEKHRLTAEGEITPDEWGDRSDRLTRRWRNVARQAKLERASLPAPELGKHIYAGTTYQHLEPLAGEGCHELYMTAGHYHRLADDDAVWWNPLFKPSRGKP